MKPRLTLLLFALLAPVIGRGAESIPAIAVSLESLGRPIRGTNSGPQYLIVVWPDGRIAWSRDQQAGGGPYLTASIEAVRVRELLRRFEQRGVFNKPGLRRSWFGPDSSYHAIWLQSGERHARLEA